MEILIKIFGEGKDLNSLQMSCRALVIYLIALLLIRIAGRRTFGKKTAFDNTIAIMLGAVLSRAIVGASPFLPTVIGSLVLVLLHRAIAWYSMYNKKFEHLVKGKSQPLYQNGKMNKENMKRGLMSEDDLRGDIRLKGQTNSLEDLDEIYIETTGEVSLIKKKK
ncbi:DUF421 domain-containing protein [Mucilaginibacter arboris]|uniref:DUF421 domain-containing protein n=1 Tax=Mucilaginibacter arboris TaxID=2682090 RepID=A0A7K1STP0_9SPHI|nr:YetF domain-containing protein [Mucilaginibacter arboris]MVN20671.1 DUF421 domain-containing protein [Mucilaginibacter arboris]